MSDSEADLNERFLRLEMKLAYQEKLLAELNEVLLERGQTVDLLEKRVTLLEKSLREGPPDGAIPNERPPHY